MANDDCIQCLMETLLNYLGWKTDNVNLCLFLYLIRLQHPSVGYVVFC